jgi:hypothetical protein
MLKLFNIGMLFISQLDFFRDIKFLIIAIKAQLTMFQKKKKQKNTSPNKSPSLGANHTGILLAQNELSIINGSPPFSWKIWIHMPIIFLIW